MTAISLTARGTAAVDVVWERYAQFALWPDWSPQISRVTADADRIAVGVKGTVFGPLRVQVRFIVTEVDEAARTWSWQVKTGPIGMVLHHSVTARGTGSATRLTVIGPAPIVLGYLAPARVAMHCLVRA